MRKGGGKSKGSGFEREIAKKIVKAYKKFGVKQRECWRSVLSGGHIISAGDLVMSDRLEQLFPYAVECKFRKRIRWENFLVGNPKTEERKWIEQALEGAAKSRNLAPLLVLKANHCPIMVLRLGTIDEEPVLTLHSMLWKAESWTKFLKKAVEVARRHKGKVV